MLFLPTFVGGAPVQAQANYYITINPQTLDSPMYTLAGMNWTVSFNAKWTYGVDSGNAIADATAIIEVKNNQNNILKKLSVKTTSDGIIAFNYSSKSADILTFTPTKVVTQDKKEWSTGIVDSQNNVYGLQSKSVVVWWDSFHASLVDSDTNNLGNSAISVNVTYQLLPEEGLTLPAWATYSNQTFLPKTAQGVNVTINGVKAEESQLPGVYSANTTTWLPTAYVHVGVSQERAITTHTGLSFAHNANEPIWIYATSFGLILIFATLTFHFAKYRRANNPSVLKHPNFPFFGGVLLAATSAVSVYWALVGLEGSLHGFDWVLLAVLGLLSFAFGLAGSIMAMQKKNHALIIFAIMVAMLTNMVGAKTFLDMYELTNPWPILITSLILSIGSGCLICNSDENFKTNQTQ